MDKIVVLKSELNLTEEQMMIRLKKLELDDEKDNSESRESLLMYLGYTLGLPRELTIPITEHVHKFMKNKNG